MIKQPLERPKLLRRCAELDESKRKEGKALLKRLGLKVDSECQKHNIVL